jgi:hypothetical protein
VYLGPAPLADRDNAYLDAQPGVGLFCRLLSFLAEHVCVDDGGSVGSPSLFRFSE